MPTYGIIISLAILVCVLLGEKRVKKDGHDLNLLWNLALVAIFSGLVGARLYHVVDLWEYYSIDPKTILYFWRGGLGIWGGLIGAFVASVVYLKLAAKKEKPAYWLDLMAGVVPLGQALGRWGNFFNQENFGIPTTLPWGIIIDRLPGQKFHPLFLYESILDLTLFFILSKFTRDSGKVVVLYLIGYSLIRFFLEFLKMNSWKIGGMAVAQIVSVTVCTVTLTYAIYLFRPRRL